MQTRLLVRSLSAVVLSSGMDVAEASEVRLCYQGLMPASNSQPARNSPMAPFASPTARIAAWKPACICGGSMKRVDIIIGEYAGSLLNFSYSENGFHCVVTQEQIFADVAHSVGDNYRYRYCDHSSRSFC